ncbi:type II toxin-antitoxin system YafO family toxin [Pseudomonas sp. AU10]|uniref:type II toxin-antitoxin system YafO family toxin n=1 Tax=Pseudomonas sp. AU10 TaxID=882697 RepID=UPI0021E32EA0|nr:type II toxin-antitoxin system YafO family toxin [Pseudomonas sp. AU10]MCV2227429.1 type II toxin-antitoxin system YafO family toxin [Pseudomonas sp. AU10]
MTVIVDYNQETYKTLFQPITQQYQSLLSGIQADFTTYIKSNRLKVPSYFGCDVPYVKHQGAYKAGLMHIHLAIPPVVFAKNKPQSDRKCPMNGNPNHDAALVYVQGLYEVDRYSLIAILHPGAHGKANDRKVMNYLAEVAVRFRDKY